MKYPIARIVLFVFAILVVAWILFLHKKQEREAALSQIEKYQIKFNRYQDELHVLIKDPAIKNLDHLADLFARAKRFRDGHPISPEVIDLTGNPGLQSLEGALKMPRLRSIIAIDCPALTSASGVTGLPHLNELILSHNRALSDVSGIRDLPSLVTLDLSRAEQLESFASQSLPALENLYLSNCRKLRTVDLSSFVNLQQLFVDNCISLTEIQGLEKMSNLTDLDLSNCESLKNLSGLRELSSLIVLDLRNMELPDYEAVNSLPRLEVLRLGGQSNIQNLEPFSNLKTLTDLHLESCNGLISLQGAPPGLSNYAGFTNCSQLKSLDGIESATGLKHLDVSNCRELSDISAVVKLQELAQLTLINCSRITDIQRIVQNRNVRFVRLGGSSVPTTSVEGLQEKLPETLFDFSVE